MAAPFSRVYYFGDSLTDEGNAVSLLASVIQPVIYLDLLLSFGGFPTSADRDRLQAEAEVLAKQTVIGSFSELGSAGAVTNAFTHASYAAALGGFETVNYAVATAKALGGGVLDGFTGLQSQIGNFAQDASGGVPANSAAFLLIGGNDFTELLEVVQQQQITTQDEFLAVATPVMTGLIAEIEAAANTLHAAGVGTVYLATQPPRGIYPEFDTLSPEHAVLADLLIETYNGMIAASAEALRGAGIDARTADLFAVSAALIEDPAGFGILAARTDYLIDGSLFDSDQVLAWDPIHPAETVHQLWGAYAEFVMGGGTTALLGNGAENLASGPAANAVFALGGDDTIAAGRGDDAVIGGSGNDHVAGGRGNDILLGGSGNDIVKGQRGNDILSGGGGDDELRGAAGDDVITGGLGSDTMFGGAGDDTFIFTEAALIGGSGPSDDIIRGGAGLDTLYLVLDDASYLEFESGNAAGVLKDIGITVFGIEAILSIRGRGSIDPMLDSFDWFDMANYWGALSAPAPTDALAF
ncbi:SGNH/GDSL hydrolase family protein (plasmid) [Roseobacteraceae bacterium NS-SX3]